MGFLGKWLSILILIFIFIFIFWGVKFGLWYLDFFIAFLFLFFKCKKLNSQTCVIRKLANHVCMYVCMYVVIF
jgi:hypothetical protein